MRTALACTCTHVALLPVTIGNGSHQRHVHRTCLYQSLQARYASTRLIGCHGPVHPGTRVAQGPRRQVYPSASR